MKLKTLLLAAAALVAMPAVAMADEPEADISFNVGIASDYVFRGVTQLVDGGPQLFAGADLSYGSFYAGTWASNVDFGSDANLEWDVYAGFKPKLGPIQFDFGVLGYLYPDESNLNTFEAKAVGTIAAENGIAFTGSVFYSPEFGKGGPSYWYTELGLSAPIPGAKIGPFALSIGASAGNFDPEFGDSYTNWKLGVTAATENGWAIDVFYTDTDVDNADAYDGRGVIQLKKTF